MRKILIITSILFITNINCQDILPLKERAAFINKLQKDRLNNLLPKLMEKTGIDMWVLIAREYNEDPIIKTMLPPTWLNARRTTIVVFSLDSKTKDFNSIRKVSEFITDKAVIDELFDNVSVKFNERNGGYSRIVLLGTRQGDNAEVATLELVE